MTTLREKVAQGIAVGITGQPDALGLTWSEAVTVGQDIARHLIPEGAVLVTEESLTEALHDAMCDVSHHDRPPARCSRWAKYPNIAASVMPRLARIRETE